MSNLPTDPFFESPREWSERKHQIFQRYLRQYALILSGRRGTVYLVDAFAGTGSYGEGSDRLPGSPLLAAQFAEELASSGKYDLRCINVEAKKENFANLTAATAPYSRLVTNYPGKFRRHIDTILSTVGTAPTLFFIDPFGIGGLEWETLAKIGRRSSITELLINLNAPKFDRHIGESRHDQLGPSFSRFLDTVTGTTDWRYIWEADLGPIAKDERYRSILGFYLTRIRQHFRMLAEAYPVRTVDGGHLKYYLIFATRNTTAMRIMSNIVSYVDRDYRERHARFVKTPLGQQSFFDDVPLPIDMATLDRDLVNELRRDIVRVGRERRSLTFAALQDELMNIWFGKASETHYRNSCKYLVRSGHIDGQERGIDDDTILRFK